MNCLRLLIFTALIGLVLLSGMGVANAQLVGVSPQTLSFAYQVGGSNPASQVLYLSGSSPTQFTVTISGAPWLTVSPTTGITPSTLVASIAVTPSLTPGTYDGSIIIGPVASTGAQKTVVAVSLVVSPSPGNLQVYPSSLSFDYGQGGPAPATSTFAITSSGNSIAFSLSSSVPWLTATPSSTVTPATAYVSVSPNNGLLPGVYSGYITVTPSYAAGSQQQVFVTLRVYTPGNLTASPNFLSFSFQPGGYPPQNQAVNITNSVGGSVPYTISTTTTSGGAWLSASPATGTTPSSLFVSAVPGGLPSGTYSGTITISPTTSGVSATQIPVTLTVYNSGQLLVSPSSLTFNYQSGTSQPSQYLSVQSTGSAINFNVGVQGPSWVTASAGVPVTPTGVSVSVNPPATTLPGTYVASVTLTPISGGGSAVSIPVTVNITSPNYLTVARSTVSIDYSTGGANPAPEFVSVTSSGVPLQFEAVASTLGFGSWLSVSQSSQYTPANVTINVVPGTLAPGTYSGTVNINSALASNGQQTIAVTLTITNSVTFVASPFGLVFSYQVNGVAPTPQAFAVSSGSTATPITPSATTVTGGNWLLVTGTGTTPAAVAVAVNTTGMGVGTYNGTIQVKSNDGSVPTIEVPVILNVSAAPVFLPSAGEVSFQYETNGAAPAPQTVTINSSSTDATVFFPSWVTADGGTWLTVSPAVAATPGAMTISINPAGLAPGWYYALISVNDPAGNTPLSYVPVSLQVSNGPLLSVATQTLSLNSITGGNASQTISVGSVGPPAQYSVTTSGGAWLSATPTQAFTGTNINVVASAANLAPGYYLGVVTVQIPGVPGTQQSVPVIFTVGF